MLVGQQGLPKSRGGKRRILHDFAAFARIFVVHLPLGTAVWPRLRLIDADVLGVLEVLFGSGYGFVMFWNFMGAVL